MKTEDLIAFLQSQLEQHGNIPVFINVNGLGARPLKEAVPVLSVNYGSGCFMPENQRPIVPYIELISTPPYERPRVP